MSLTGGYTTFFDFTKIIDSPALNEKLYGVKNSYHSQVHCFSTINVDNTIPDGSARIFTKFDSQEFFEAKCGDISGKVCKKNPTLKFDTQIVKFVPDSSIQLGMWKPGTFGVWGEMYSVLLKKEEFAARHNSRNFYFFFDNDGDNYFKIDANRLDYVEMI
ncbi:hypothetical protein ACTFIY_004007 [Dictyostelium cf. discoideum]